MRDFIDLMESYEWLLLETPQRLAWLVSNFGAKLQAKYASDVENSLIPASIQNEVEPGSANPPAEGEVKPPPNPEAIAAYIMKFDPSGNKSYARWMVSCYLRGTDRFEDIDENLGRNLTTFARAAQAKRITLPPPPEGQKPKDPNNIDTYQSFSALNRIVHPFNTGRREVSGRADRAAGRVTKYDTEAPVVDESNRMWGKDDPMRKQATVLYDGPDYMVLIPNTFEAAKYFGENTGWCTTQKSRYDQYVHGTGMYSDNSGSGSPLYIILDRSDNKRWQFHFDPKNPQFKDEHDAPIDINKFIEEHKKVFDIIGPEKFAPLIGMKDVVGQNLSIRHFSPEVIAQQDPKVLARATTSIKDIKALPPELANTKEFFEGLLPRLAPSSGRERWRYDDPIAEPEAKAIIDYYAKKLRDPDLFSDLVGKFSWLLNLLPERLQTERAKENAMHGVRQWEDIDKLIPKPWPHHVERTYWNMRAENDNGLSPEELPEDQRNDENLANTLATHPEFMEKFSDRLNDSFVKQMVRHIINYPRRLEDLLEHLPEKYKDKALQKQFFEQAKQYTKKSEQDERDNYLRLLTKFDNQLWPWSASRVSGRMAELNQHFMNNPDQFHSKHFAESWIVEHPFQLNTLPAEFVDEKVVANAIGEEPNSNRIASVLKDCDPKIITQQMVTTALDRIPDLSKCWSGIPKHYLTHDTIAVLLSKGDIDFADDRFPKDGFTPQNIAARFARVVGVLNKVEKDGRPVYDYGGRQKTEPNLAGFKEHWEALPPEAQTPETALALMPRYHSLVQAMPQSVLAKPEMLDAWLKAQGSYGGHNAKPQFEHFPSSSHTPRNMAEAVHKHIIDTVPTALHDDDVLLNLMKNWSSKKSVDWDNIPEPLFLRLCKEAPTDAMNNLQYNVPKSSPLHFSEPIAYSLLSSKKTEGSYREVKDSELENEYGAPGRRKNWEQRDYDLAAGNIIPLDKVPEKFRSEKALQRAVLTDPKSILLIKDPAKWLSKLSKVGDVTIARLLSYGIAKTPKGWEDFRNAKRETIPGVPGSYVVTSVEPKGHAIMVFDDEGKCLNSILVGVSAGSRNAYESEFYSSAIGQEYSTRENAGAPLLPYRLLIADALKKHPNLSRDLMAGRGGSNLEKFLIFSHDNQYAPVENFPRKAVDGSSLTWVAPHMAYNYGHGKSYFLFDAQGPMVGRVVLSESGRGTSFEACQFKGAVSEIMKLSKGMAEFMSDQYVSSGNNPKFKDSAMYKVYGVRGPGGGEWFSLLDEKVTTVGDLSIWKSGARISVTNENGLLCTGKKMKDGSATITEFFTDDEKKKVEAMRFLDTANSKF